MAPKFPPLTKEEIEEKYEESLEELEEVMEWVKEEKDKINNSKTPEKEVKKAKRELKKAEWRLNTVRGMKLYWELRKKGESHFKANIEKNEFWAKCKEEQKKKS